MIPEILTLSVLACLLALFLPIISDEKLRPIRVDSGKRDGYPMK